MRKVGILGAGYIASHHVNALKRLHNVTIAAVCDINLNKAKVLADTFPQSVAFSSLDEMLDKTKPDVIHVLTPPDCHYDESAQILKQGIHLFLEKPMAVKADQCQELNSLAEKHRVRMEVNHNFLFYSAYLKLKKALTDQQLGKLDQIVIKWQKNLDQIRHGPYGIWMLREPQNLWLETGPHLCAMLLDLLGNNISIQFCQADDEIQLPNHQWVYRRWIVIGNSGNVHFEMNIALNPGFEEKSVELRGQAGYAKVDFEKDTLLIKRHTCYSAPFDIYYMNRQEALSSLKQGHDFIITYIKSKFKLAGFGDPYAASIAKSISKFYGSLEDFEVSPFGKQVMDLCETVVSKVSLKRTFHEIQPIKSRSVPEILVLGGTGFIGQALTRSLVRQGCAVRVLARDPDKLADLSKHANVEFYKGDLLQPGVLMEALKGIKYVFHLATARVKSWKDYLHQDVEVTRSIGEACLAAGVKRLIYTGTIDSYYAGNKNEIITEDTPFDPKIHRRNYYAQAKALGEQILRKQQVPAVIVRPGIVIGEGGSPFHWGVGMWHYETSCQLWGQGTHPLPFVLVEDVVQGLILAMLKESIEGQSFNLVDKPCLTGQDYLIALEKALEAKINKFQTPIWKFYGIEYFKWIVKVLVNHKERRYPSWRDWASRSLRASFDCSKARSHLGWKPVNNKEGLLEEGIRKPAKAWWS